MGLTMLDKSPEVKWAWVAGLFEGEGCCHCSSNPQISIRIRMTDEDTIARLPIITGLGATNTWSQDNRPNRKQVYSWEITKRDDVEIFLSIVWDFLSIRRKQQVREAVEKYMEIQLMKPGDPVRYPRWHPRLLLSKWSAEPEAAWG
jgi:hypothetical protein